MKKFLLSLAVIVVFAGYALRNHFGGADDAAPVVAPATNTSTSTYTPTSSGSTDSSSSGSSTPPDTSSSGSGMGMMNTNTSMGHMMGQFRDGSYTGDPADAFYGYIQVRVTVSNGQIADVKFLQYPNDRQTSIAINSQAMPYLKSEAIQAQSANVNIVSGATDSSLAFRQSLQSALDQAS